MAQNTKHRWVSEYIHDMLFLEHKDIDLHVSYQLVLELMELTKLTGTEHAF